MSSSAPAADVAGLAVASPEAAADWGIVAVEGCEGGVVGRRPLFSGSLFAEIGWVSRHRIAVVRAGGLVPMGDPGDPVTRSEVIILDSVEDWARRVRRSGGRPQLVTVDT
ncbi:hypothetical protein [Nocardia xishanensis]|uniref:hypothetical protein n=1 Tax=Nocardia xishanensis TaxID=238964 RepID=UPI000829A3E3|nr:hypothetical protein [Nocardia xishanensis]